MKWIIQWLSLSGFIVCYSITDTLKAQTLKPWVNSSSGANYVAGSYQLSQTIGEPFTSTLSPLGGIPPGNSLVLTQGFQQPYRLRLKLRTFLQGYYQGAGIMRSALFNQGVTNDPSFGCDTVIIQLREPVAPYNLVSEAKQVIQNDGWVTFAGQALPAQWYYIVLKHRHTLETWSAAPVILNEFTDYDFSNLAAKAYGSNQVEVDPGVFALYAGDVSQDENVDLLDANLVESDLTNFMSGYYATDINGDGNVDLIDLPIVEQNINQFVFTMKP